MLFTMRLAGITYRPVVQKMRRHAKRLSAYLTTNADSLPMRESHGGAPLP